MLNIIVSQETIFTCTIFLTSGSNIGHVGPCSSQFKFAFNFVQFVSELQPPFFYDNDYKNVIEMMVNLLILLNY
jgi:hypothetical protein